MNCQQSRQQLLLYLYSELDDASEKILRHHLDKCADCTEELMELAEVQNLLDQSVPAEWHVKNDARRNYLPWLAVTAGWLIALYLGWQMHDWSPRDTPVSTKIAYTKDEFIALLGQNQNYRASLSQGQLLLIQKMEKQLAKTVDMTKLVDDLHSLETLQWQQNLSAAVIEQQNFLKSYPNIVVSNIIRIQLANNLTAMKQHQKAAPVYQKILQDPNLLPHQRGEYLWQLSLSYKDSKQDSYRRLWYELAAEKSYGTFHWRAIKAIADQNFYHQRFERAQRGYQRYLVGGKENLGEAKQKLQWIKFHESDNYHPLLLFLQAQRQGTEAYYGLRIILSSYPDSPLAFEACTMYLKNIEPANLYQLPRSFPTRKTPEALVPYLSEIAQLTELQEVAIFARYWRAHLLEQQGEVKRALQDYQQIKALGKGQRLAEIAQRDILRLQTISVNQKRRN